MNTPNPALVTQREAQRLPRMPLLLLCAAYLLPGLFGRDPWKSADISAFGYMLSIAQGQSPWWAPTVGGLPPESAVLPYWLGAAFIKLLGPWLGAPLAARIPFALLLGLVLVLTWYSAYHLARTEAAQPLPLAFGGEASSVDYARAIADGALLGLIATPRPAATRPRDDAGTGATHRRRALSSTRWPAARSQPGSPGWRCSSSLPMLVGQRRAQRGRGSGHRRLGRQRRVARRRRARRSRWWIAAPWLLAVAAGDGDERLGVARQRASVRCSRSARCCACCCGSPGRRWPLALWTLWRWRRQLRSRHLLGAAGLRRRGVCSPASRWARRIAR